MVIKRRVAKFSSVDDRSMLNAVLSSHNVMALATLGDDAPYSTPVFYVPADDFQSLLYMSKTSTQHSQHVINNARASACVYADTKDVGLLHGIQITGMVSSPEGSEQKKLRDIYCRAYPQARLARFVGTRYRIYALRIETAKLTDNRLGFGTSFLWDFRQVSA